MTGHHRKHGIRLLGQSSDDGEQQPAVKKGRLIYDEAVRQALIVVWEAADRICGKRLQAALPHLVESMERHGHLDLDPGVRQLLLAASAATLDRLLQPIRTPASRRLRRRRPPPLGRNIPVREPSPSGGNAGPTARGRFLDRLSLVAHLRTLRLPVQQWRGMMAQQPGLRHRYRAHGWTRCKAGISAGWAGPQVLKFR